MSSKGNGISFNQIFKGKSTKENGIFYLQRVAYYAFTQIICARKAIQNQSYMKKPIDGQPFRLYILKKEADFVAKRVHSKLFGAIDAIGKGYLKELILVISNNEENSDDALEVFTMRFVYGDEPHMELIDENGKTLSSAIRFRGEEYAEGDFYKFLDDITILCHIMEKLPRDAYCSFRSTFYDEIIPKDYMPKGWYDAQTLYDFNHKDALDSFEIGEFHTSDSALFLSVKSFAIHDEIEVLESMKRARSTYTERNDSMNKTVNSDESSFFAVNFQHFNSPIISGSINGATQNRKEEKLATQMKDMAIEEQESKLENVGRRHNLRPKLQQSHESLASHSEENADAKDSVGPIKKGRKAKSKISGPILLPSKKSKTYRLDKSTPGVASPTSPARSRI